jgi:predicted  nucleic acid-binding Zn-ribbon protein
MRSLTGTIRKLAIVGLLFAVAGCTTYQQQKADALSGGPERRLRAAEERQQAAEDRKQGLDTDKEDLDEEIGLQERRLTELDARIADQTRVLDKARSDNRISRQQELRMRKEFTHLQDSVLDLQFRMDVANATGGGSKAEQAAMQKQYDTLTKDVQTREKELELLLQQ